MQKMTKKISKNSAREFGLKSRRELSFILRKIKSLKIQRKIIKSLEFKKASKIALYFPLKTEVSTKHIIKSALRKGKVVALPTISDNKMHMVQITSLSNMEFKKNFMQPKLGTQITKDEIDLVIAPVVAFDKQRNRIGFGKGHYDKFLVGYDGNKIGIAFSCQEVQNIDAQEYDIRMDKIVTEK